MKKWIDINGFGELFLEIVLVRFDIPLLFVCLDKNRKRYLILCVDEELGQYLVAECPNKKLLEMLNNEIPMEAAFKAAAGKKVILIQYNFENNIFDFEFYDIKKITQDMLPDAGAYFKLRNKKIEDYIEKLKDEINWNYKIRIKSSCENFATYLNYSCDENADEQSSQWYPIKSERSYLFYYYFNHITVDFMNNEFNEENYYRLIKSNVICEERNLCSLNAN